MELTRKTFVCNTAHLSKIKFRLSHDNLLHLANIINLMTLCLFSMFVLLSDICLETYYCDTKGILHFQTIGNYTNGWHKQNTTLCSKYWIDISNERTFLKNHIKNDLYPVKLIEHSIIIEIINKHGYIQKYSQHKLFSLRTVFGWLVIQNIARLFYPFLAFFESKF